MKLRYTNRAARQIEEALDYIGFRSPSGAARIQERIRAVETLLQLHPYDGHITSRVGVRRFALIPFSDLIDYRVMGEEIIIMRFRHSAQKPL